jgi:site-specific DNA recombinase
VGGESFELLQTKRQQWLTADYPEKPRWLEIVLLNCTLDGVALCPEMRKPFHVLAEGLLVSSSRGDRI